MKRVSIACGNCRIKKRKCDTANPCSNCRKSGRICQYNFDNQRKPVSKKYISSLLDRISVLSESVDSKKQYPVLRKRNFAFLFDDSIKHENSSILHVPHLVNETLDLKFCGPASGRIFKNKIDFTDASKTIFFDPPYEPYFLQSIDTHHDAIFNWYFLNIHPILPMISKKLFFESLCNEGSELGPWVSNSLINAITAFYYFINSNDLFYTYQELCKEQINKEISTPNITCVQALIILSIIEMNDNNEHMASIHIAMSCSLSITLGIHLDCSKYVSAGILTIDEANVRSLTLWCCFIIDMLRGPILGVFPYFKAEITTGISLIPDIETLIFKNFCSFLVIQDEALDPIYSIKHQFTSTVESLNARCMYISEANVILETWRRNLPKACRNLEDPKRLPFFLTFCVDCYLINLYRPILNLDSEDFDTLDDPIVTKLMSSAKNILKMATHSEVFTSPFLFQYAYGVFISAKLFILHLKVNSNQMFSSLVKKSLELLEKFGKIAKISFVYKEQLETLIET